MSENNVENRSGEYPSTTSSNGSNQIKPINEDEVYNGIRGHERHILFHFFLLFMASFFIGVFIIHLSLWINANYFSTNSYANNLTPEVEVMTSSSVTSSEYDEKVVDDLFKNWFEPIRISHLIYDNQISNVTSSSMTSSNFQII